MAKLGISLILISLFINTVTWTADSSRVIGAIYCDSQVSKHDNKPVLDQKTSNKDVAIPKNNIARPTMVGGVR